MLLLFTPPEHAANEVYIAIKNATGQTVKEGMCGILPDGVNQWERLNGLTQEFSTRPSRVDECEIVKPPMANLLLSVMGAFAQFERELLRERQREGIELAKKAGVYRGRKHTLSIERAAELRRRIVRGEAKAALAREFGVDRTTVYRYIAREVKSGARE